MNDGVKVHFVKSGKKLLSVSIIVINLIQQRIPQDRRQKKINLHVSECEVNFRIFKSFQRAQSIDLLGLIITIYIFK